MAQEQIQEQKLTQQQKLSQGFTQQQLLQAHLTEMPIMQLLERINTEMNDNPALEPSDGDGNESSEFSEPTDHSENTENADNSYEQEERQSAIDAALESIGRDDEDLPVYYNGTEHGESREDMVYGQTESFIDQLNEQMNMTEPDRTRTQHHGIPDRFAGRRRTVTKIALST